MSQEVKEGESRRGGRRRRGILRRPTRERVLQKKRKGVAEDDGAKPRELGRVGSCLYLEPFLHPAQDEPEQVSVLGGSGRRVEEPQEEVRLEAGHYGTKPGHFET